MKDPRSALIIPREMGDFWGSGFTQLYFSWDDRSYRVPPVDGYKFVDGEWEFTISWRYQGWIAPGIFFAGGYVIHAVPVIEE